MYKNNLWLNGVILHFVIVRTDVLDEGHKAVLICVHFGQHSVYGSGELLVGIDFVSLHGAFAGICVDVW